MHSTVTPMDRNEWRLPVNMTIGFHVLLFLSVIYLPELLKPSVKFPEIYTVTLVNYAEPAAVEAPTPAQPTPPAPKAKPVIRDIKIKPVTIKKVIAPVKPKPVPKVAPVKKAVSIKPIKRKRKKIIRQQKKSPDRSYEEAQKKLERAKLLEKQARQEAIQAAKRVSAIKQQYRQSNNKGSGKSRSGGGQQTGVNNLLESSYQAKIFSRLQQYWSLPEYKKWDPGLAAIVVITIRSDGRIINQYFQKKSGDRFFDQFVMSTLQKAGSMPPIPPALKKRQYKIGLRFKPGSIQ